MHIPVGGQARLVLEACVLLGAVVYLFLAMKEIHHQGFHIFFCTLVRLHALFAKTLDIQANLFRHSLYIGSN